MSVKSLLLSLVLLAGWHSPAALSADAGTDAASSTAAATAAPGPAAEADTTHGGAGDASAADNAAGPDNAAAAEQPRDVVLVLDNSGSMKKNDPDHLTVPAVKEFVSRLEPDTRLGIIIFDQDVRLAMPLSPLSEESREQISKSLGEINYKGLFTDSPAAIERAIYELKNNGRKNSRKFIVFMTDGIVDTGNEAKDVEKTRWLREDLAPAAADAGIKIYGIAFTNDADFQLIQTLAQKTGGEYFRALKPKDLQGVFQHITASMNKPAEPAKPAPETKPQPAAPQPSPQPVVIKVPQQSPQSMDQAERTRSIIIISAAAVLIVALVVMIIVLIRRSRDLQEDGKEEVTEAYLNDIHGYTPQAVYKLGSKPTMLGRVAGKDTTHLDYIVIPESTIGRRHALIEYKDFAYWIVDQGSINGTFVNDVPVNSEVRLKHGDRIRLHKLEFEFLMPEMEEAGMTVMSNTVFAQEGESDDAATVMRDATGGAAAQEFDLDLDLSDADTRTGAGDEDETLMPGQEDGGQEDSGQEDSGQAAEDAAGYDAEDETLIPGSEGEPEAGADVEPEDETLLPGEFDLPDEDETLRDNSSEGSLEDFFDVTDMDNGKNKDRKE